MSYIKYTPSIHTPATKEEIQQISDDLKYGCSSEQVEAMTESINDALEALKVVDSLCDTSCAQVEFPRTPGHKPRPTDRYRSAWAWKCHVHSNNRGRLSKKTIAIKDNIAVACAPMSNGSRLLEGYIPEYDATVVKRILDAGGSIMGKSACDDFCMSSMGYSGVDGYIYHPDRPDVRVGGSSGGSAILVAARQVDIAIAADQGGSIRIPAAWTGTVGLKPTFGLVPYTGIISIEPLVDHVGPIARNTHDCALMLEVIAGPDDMDSRQWPIPAVPKYFEMLDDGFKGMKIGVLKEGFETCIPATQAAVKEFLKDYHQRAGLVMVNVSVPYHKHALAFYKASVTQGAQTCLQMGTRAQFIQGWYPSSLEKAVRRGLQCSAELLSPGVKNYTMFGELVKRRYGNHYYSKTRNLIRELTFQYDLALRECDVIVMPTLTHTAIKFPEQKESEVASQIAYLTESNSMLANTVAANLTGHPALSLPLGELGDGKSDSIMIVGKKFDEVKVLQVARALEKVIPGRKNAILTLST